MINNTRISIIIPVLNEAGVIAKTLSRIRKGDEVIVVDGGSDDDTVAVANTMGAKVILSTIKGRAHQMNQGALVASGEILMFLHGDTQLPNDYQEMVRQALAIPGTVAGAFDLAIDDKGWGLRWVEMGVRWRSHFFSLPYGDQVIFLNTSTFRDIGGFPLLPIMEDFEMMLTLRKKGRITIVPSSVTTCARRWQKLGIVRTTIINQMIIFGYLLGVPAHKLKGLYKYFK